MTATKHETKSSCGSTCTLFPVLKAARGGRKAAHCLSTGSRPFCPRVLSCFARTDSAFAEPAGARVCAAAGIPEGSRLAPEKFFCAWRPAPRRAAPCASKMSPCAIQYGIPKPMMKPSTIALAAPVKLKTTRTRTTPTGGRARHITNDPLKLKDELIDRITASLCGLHRICIFRLCRRHKSCFGPGVLCLKHHRGLMRARLPRAVLCLPE